MRMTAIPEVEEAELLSAIGARVLEVQAYAVPSGEGRIYFVTKS